MKSTLATRLLKAMTEAGFASQSDLSRNAGVPQPTINRILKGHGGPQIKTAEKLAKACKVSTTWLLGDDTNNGKTSASKNAALSPSQNQWLLLMDYLGSDDIREFSALIKARQERNKRLLKDLGAL